MNPTEPRTLHIIEAELSSARDDVNEQWKAYQRACERMRRLSEERTQLLMMEKVMKARELVRVA